MAEFTKGMWEFNPETGHITANGAIIANVAGATVHNQTENASEAFANARLIVNAPKMYEVLRQCLEDALDHHKADGCITSQILYAVDGKTEVRETIYDY